VSQQPAGQTVEDPAAQAARRQWEGWAASRPDIPKRQRAKAVNEALAALRSGATSDQAAAAGVAAAREGYAAYYARASVIVGAIGLVISILTGGISVLLGGATVFAGYQGLKSATRHTEAIIGLVLGALALLLFAAHLFGLAVPTGR
jgi:hypothetical protein